MTTETYTLKELKNEIILAHGTKKEAPSYAYHEAVTNVKRNYRQYCKDVAQYNKLLNWVRGYY